LSSLALRNGTQTELCCYT